MRSLRRASRRESGGGSVRGRYFLLLFSLIAVALGAWQLWGHVGRTVPPETGNLVRNEADDASTAPTAVDEGGLFPPVSAAHGPTILHARPPRTRPIARPRPVVSSPQRLQPPREPRPEGRPEPAPPLSSVATASPATESGSGHEIAQETGDSASPDSTAAGSHEVSPSQPAADTASSPPLIPVVPPRLTPPRVIDTAGIGYPGEAFHLTLRRQDLGPELAVEGAEGTVVLRVLISADGVARSVDVAASSGSPVLDQAAAAAVRRWRFTPATRNAVPINAYAVLRIRYIVR